MAQSRKILDQLAHGPPGSLAIPSGSTSQNLLLDSAIRDWVVLPLLVMLITAGLLRHYISNILRPSEPKRIPYVAHRTRSAIARASMLRKGGSGFLSINKWKGRIAYWTDNEKGYIKEEIEWVTEEEEIKEKEQSKNGVKDEDLPDPMVMLGPMKGQFVAMAQNMLMMQGISYLFQGFVLVKVPFHLTNGFKGMFQRGLDLSNLDTSYVSSVSWYFLVMFGLRGVFGLIIGDADGGQEKKESLILQSEFGFTSNHGVSPRQEYDSVGALKLEIEHLQVASFRGNLDDAERRLLGSRYPKKKSGGWI